MRNKTIKMTLSPGFVHEGTKYCWFLAGYEGRLYKVSTVRVDGSTEWVRASWLTTLRFAGAWGLWSRLLHVCDVLLRRNR